MSEPKTEAGRKLDLAWPGTHMDRLAWQAAIVAVEGQAASRETARDALALLKAARDSGVMLAATEATKLAAALSSHETTPAPDAGLRDMLAEAVIEALDVYGTMGNGEGWTLDLDVIGTLWKALTPEERARTGYRVAETDARYQALDAQREGRLLAATPSAAALSSPETTPAAPDQPFVVRQFEGTPWVPLHEAARLHDAVQESGLTIAALRNDLNALHSETTPAGVLDEAALAAIPMPDWHDKPSYVHGWNTAMAAVRAALGRSGSGGGRG